MLVGLFKDPTVQYGFYVLPVTGQGYRLFPTPLGCCFSPVDDVLELSILFGFYNTEKDFGEVLAAMDEQAAKPDMEQAVLFSVAESITIKIRELGAPIPPAWEKLTPFKERITEAAEQAQLGHLPNWPLILSTAEVKEIKSREPKC